jgi:hypothetical protein
MRGRYIVMVIGPSVVSFERVFSIEESLGGGDEFEG